VDRSPGMDGEQHDLVGNQSDGGLSIFGRPGGMGWEKRVAIKVTGKLAPHWQERYRS